jgi:D-sedoheptulose 7-phosphate isomerase
MLNIDNIFEQHLEVLQATKNLIPTLKRISENVSERVLNGATVFWCGNGGSAADAQHCAAELIGRFYKERRAIASIALNTDTSVLTALGNDYSFDCVFSRQLEGLCRQNDVVICISTSGNSSNILKAAKVAKQKGAYVVGFIGHQGGQLAQLVDDCLIVPSDCTPRIQEMHSLMGHTLCEWIERAVL